MEVTSKSTHPTRVRYRVMAFLLILAFLTYFDRVCIVRVQREIQVDLALTDGQLAWVFSAFWLAYAMFQIPSGWLGDRYGARRGLVRVVLFWSLFTALSGAATGFTTLIAARFLFGVGEAGAFPIMARVQAKWLPAETRGRAGGLLWLAARWGGAFSPMIVGAIMAQAESLDLGVAGWRVAFWVAGAAGLIWCLAFYPWFRDEPVNCPAVNRAELEIIRGTAPPPEAAAVSRTVIAQVLRCRSLWALGCLYLLFGFGWSFTATSWMPRYLHDAHGVTFERSQDVWKQPLFYGGISCLIGGVLSDRLVRRTGWGWFGRAIFPMTGLCVAAAGLIGITASADPDTVVILVCVVGAALDFGQGANWAAIVSIGGRYAGVASGFVIAIDNLSSFAQPLISERVFTMFGWNPLLALYAGSMVAAAAMWLLIDPRRTFHDGLSSDTRDAIGSTKGPMAHAS